MPKPFFRHPGGKRKLLAQYSPYVPADFGRFLSPFVGGGALFFDLAPDVAILGDSCPPLIAAYRAVQSSLPELADALRWWPATAEGFFHARDVVSRPAGPLGPVPLELAVAFLVVKAMGYSGLWRVNKSGECNVGLDKGKVGTDLVRMPMLLQAREALRAHVTLACVDFEEVLDLAGPGDFVFSDSPYAPKPGKGSPGLDGHRALKKCFVEYTSAGFTHIDQTRLLCGLISARERGAYVLASNSWEPGLVRRYQRAGFEAVPIQAARNINSDGKGRGLVQEVLFVGRPAKSQAAAVVHPRLRPPAGELRSTCAA